MQRGTLGVIAAGVLLVLGVGVAAAAGTLALLGSFASSGSGAGQLNVPFGVAVDRSGDSSRGDVYVADLGNQRVEKFGSVGNFLLAVGKEVNGTKVKEAAEGKSVSEAEENVCSASSGDACQAGKEGSGNHEFSFPLGVGVDPASGDVYVQDFANQRVEKYTPAGELLLMFGGSVNKTTGGNVCTAVEVCQAGATAAAGEAGEGKFHAWAIGALVAVGPSGTVYVGDENRVQEFESNGVYQGQIELPAGGKVLALAVDGAGNVYVKDEAAAGVRKFEPSGSSYVESATRFDEGSTSVAGVSVDPAGTVSVLDFGAGYRVQQYNSAGTLLAESAPGQIEESTGIAANASGTVYVSAPNTGKVLLLGSRPSEGNPPPAIDAEFASHVGTSSAALGAAINPEFLPSTYYIEYGTDSSYSQGSVPVPPGVALGAENLRDDPASVSLEGLRSGTTYHYRFVALSKAGMTLGSDRTFTTKQAGSFALPDGRAFELVSPLENNTAEVGLPPAGGETLLPLQASPAGETIAYTSFTAFGDAKGAPAASQYLSSRGATGWSTQNITPPDSEGYLRPPLRGFSPDLSTGVVIQREPTLAPGAVAGYENVYLRDDMSGALRALTTVPPRVSSGERYCDAYAGASPDFKHVIFLATGALTPNAPEAPGRSLYEWSQADGIQLVSVLPGETPAQPNGRTGFGPGEGLGCNMGEKVVDHAISADGTRIFWTYYPEGASSELLVRENGTKTVQIDVPHGGSGGAGSGKFWGASADGSKVFFTDDSALTANAVPSSRKNLYEYELNTETLTDLTPVPEGQEAKVQGLVGASEDGSYVYFVAESALAAGAAGGQDNLYVWHAGEGTRFIATLSKEAYSYVYHGFNQGYADGLDWSEEPKRQTARVTPDGHHLAFESTNSLKTVNYPQGYDSVDQATGEPDSEVYLYSAEDGSLLCASCNPSGARPVGLSSGAGLSSVPAWYTPYQQPRYLSEDGGRLFFNSFDALTPQDTNGKQNVYEWERQGLGSCTPSSPGFSESAGGCLFSLSTGTSSDDSSFLEASADGRDVFFSTRQALVEPAEGERFQIYDARVGGGFPPPPPPPIACGDEAGCRPASPAGPLFGPAASETLSGDGNLTARASGVESTQTGRPSGVQQLAKALRACAKKPRKERAACVRRAKKRYGVKKAAKRRRGRVNR
jgi:hypothetical protein